MEQTAILEGESPRRSSRGKIGVGDKCLRNGVGVGKRLKREGMYVYLWLIHVVIWHKPTQHCKAIILKLKINFLKTVKCFV